MVKVRVGGAPHKLHELTVKFQAGAVIFREHELGREMYIIQSGRVRISLAAGDSEREVAVLEKGDFFGEMALLDASSARSATAVAIEEVEALQLRSPDLDQLLRRKPDIAVRMMMKLAERLRETNRRLEETGVRSELVTLLPSPVSQGIAAPGVLVHESSDRIFPLRLGAATTLGRHDPMTGVTPDVDLSLLDPERTVSRRHATIVIQDGGATITETSASTNGTFVNGVRLEPRQTLSLATGDAVQLALVPLRLHLFPGGG